MDRILEEITKGEAISQRELDTLLSSMTQKIQTNTVSIVISLVCGVLLCLLGLKLVKLWSVFQGLLVGAAIGLVACILFGFSGITVLLVILFAAILMLVLSLMFTRLGMFWICLFAGSSIGTVVMYISPSAGLLVGMIAGALAAILAAILKDPVVIIMTAIQGGIICGTALTGLLGTDKFIIGAAAGVVLAILGMVVQFAIKSKEIGRKQTVRARSIKEEASMENEIEAARSILEDSDDEYDD